MPLLRTLRTATLHEALVWRDLLTVACWAAGLAVVDAAQRAARR